MKIFIRILRAFFIVSIITPYAYVTFVYSNYWNAFEVLGVCLLSAFILIISNVLLTFFDEAIKKRYIYTIIAFLAMGGFIFAWSYLSQYADYLFIQRNEYKLNNAIKEMRTEKISRVYADDSSDEFKTIKRTLNELQINDAQVTEDGSILFMEGGFMEANGWCYSETGNKPGKYFVNVWLADGENYSFITYWNHSHGNWYRWAAR